MLGGEEQLDGVVDQMARLGDKKGLATGDNGQAPWVVDA